MEEETMMFEYDQDKQHIQVFVSNDGVPSNCREFYDEEENAKYLKMIKSGELEMKKIWLDEESGS